MLRIVPLTEAVEWLLWVLHTSVPQLGCSSIWKIRQKLQQDCKQTSQSSQGSRADAFHYRYTDLRRRSWSWECCFMCVRLYVHSACWPCWFNRNPPSRWAYWGKEQCAKAAWLYAQGVVHPGLRRASAELWQWRPCICGCSVRGEFRLGCKPQLALICTINALHLVVI